MDNQQKYLSKYSNGKYVSAAQYITELICENKARKDRLDLHYKFWTQKSWMAFFRNQIASAHKLLKQYEAKAIINAIKDDRASKIYSLRAPHLISIIEEKQSSLSLQNTDLTININRNNKTFRQKKEQTKNIVSKLKELE
jgi:hypothetical protein